jgi:hypothetical protein
LIVVGLDCSPVVHKFIHVNGGKLFGPKVKTLHAQWITSAKVVVELPSACHAKVFWMALRKAPLGQGNPLMNFADRLAWRISVNMGKYS